MKHFFLEGLIGLFFTSVILLVSLFASKEMPFVYQGF